MEELTGWKVIRTTETGTEISMVLEERDADILVDVWSKFPGTIIKKPIYDEIEEPRLEVEWLR